MKNASKIAFLVLILSSSAFVLPFVSLVSAQYPGGYSFVHLTTSVNVAGGGIVTPISGLCYYGQIVTATENPNTGYLFDGWYVNGVYQGNQTTLRITMLQDCTILASFSRRVVYLTIAANPSSGGSTAPSAGVLTYTFGDVVSVTESPAAGYTFSGWYVDGTYIGVGSLAKVTMTQDHQLNAFFSSGSGNYTLLPGPTATPMPNIIQPINPSRPILQFDCASSTTLSGFNVRITGNLFTNGSTNAVGISNQGIQLSYSVTGGATWNDLAYVTTDDSGYFNAVWMPSASGNYMIRATWLGNQLYSSVVTVVSFAIAPPESQTQTLFTVMSNSTITSFAFDATTSRLTFGVYGPDGTKGFVQVCVPKSILPDPSVMIVTLDGSPVATTYLSSGNIWQIIFVYSHSSHNVVMNLNPNAATPTPTPTPVPTSTQTPSPTSTQTAQPTTHPTTSSTSSPSPTPTVPEFLPYVIFPIFISILVVALIFRQRKHGKPD